MNQSEDERSGDSLETLSLRRYYFAYSSHPRSLYCGDFSLFNLDHRQARVPRNAQFLFLGSSTRKNKERTLSRENAPMNRDTK